MPASGPVPTLSRVQSWDTDHLAEAATNWSNTASLWEDTFAQVSQQMAYPGGMAWKGAAADVAQQRVRADEVKVLELANQLDGAAGVARSSDDQIEAAKRAVLAAVAATEEAGFTVGEDFSVTSRQTGDASVIAARQAQAEAFAAEIRARVVQLIALDQEAAARITAAASGVGTFTFTGPGGDGSHDPTIQAVDNHTIKQAPPPLPSEAERQRNQIDAFKQIFGRAPVSATDWATAAALDPHSYDAKNGGVPPNIVVGRIKRVPGQGVVRTNLFIPGEKEWTPLGDNPGDNRGFSAVAGPEESRVTLTVDYDKGIVIARQNPSVMAGPNGNNVQAGTSSSKWDERRWQTPPEVMTCLRRPPMVGFDGLAPTPR